MSDIEIARSIKLENINQISKKFNIPEEFIEPYGKYKAKVDNKFTESLKEKKDGKLILVTSINPTPLGEGKTTVAIGLADALNQLNKKAVLALREPSLGPVFGIKGGATGGGYSQVAPMEEINLHFTGDIHAITSANNLLSAMIDNHLFYGNELKFKKVIWKRCLDLNDRSLRKIEIGLSKEKNMQQREDGFDISVASEIMAIFCLATDLEDLKRRIGNIIVGFNENDEPITAKDLKADGALTVLLKEAFRPNIVQTLEHNLAIIHGGPFANIAQGCNSVVATRMALKLGDYVVTEAGFGADLGAEKFVDIKCRKANLKVDVAVCVATLKALKYHAGLSVEECNKENVDALKLGINNLLKHVNNLREELGLNVIVAINKFTSDTEEEINTLMNILKENNIEVSISDVWNYGGRGAIDLAEKIIKSSNEEKDIKYVYELNKGIKQKINDIATKIYGASGVEFSKEAEEEITKIDELGFSNLPICIAKTQYSFSDNAKNLLCEEPFKIHINEINLKAGAEFIVAKSGKIFTMPGLPKVPSAEKIDIDENENIVGIF